jgi:hypothetical protein
LNNLKDNSADEFTMLKELAEKWLHHFASDADGIFHKLFPEIDDDMLREIAAADYGSDIEQHLGPLSKWRDHRVIPELKWHPREVLELIRWSQPESQNWKPGSSGRRGHLLRAFACATLLRSYAKPENSDHWLSLNETVIQLFESIQALGEDYRPAGTQFLAWCFKSLVLAQDAEQEAAFFGVALLGLAANDKSYADGAIIGLCHWIELTVSYQVEQSHVPVTNNGWLLSISYHNQRNEAWKRLGTELCEVAAKHPISERATRIAQIGQALMGQEMG